MFMALALFSLSSLPFCVPCSFKKKVIAPLVAPFHLMLLSKGDGRRVDEREE
jgi:hypothetical protein